MKCHDFHAITRYLYKSRERQNYELQLLTYLLKNKAGETLIFVLFLVVSYFHKIDKNKITNQII